MDLLKYLHVTEREESEGCFSDDVSFADCIDTLIATIGAETAARVGASSSIVAQYKEAIFYGERILLACCSCFCPWVEVGFSEGMTVFGSRFADCHSPVFYSDSFTWESDYSFYESVFFSLRDENNNIAPVIVMGVVVSFVNDEKVAIVDSVFHAWTYDGKWIEYEKSDK